MGTVAENPEEEELPMPASLQTQRHEQYSFQEDGEDDGKRRPTLLAQTSKVWLLSNETYAEGIALAILQKVCLHRQASFACRYDRLSVFRVCHRHGSSHKSFLQVLLVLLMKPVRERARVKTMMMKKVSLAARSP